MRRLVFGLLCACACSRGGVRRDVTPPIAAQAPQAAAEEAVLQDFEAAPPLHEAERVEHALARLTFGPSPADRARIQQLGVAAFVEEQLHPESIDDVAVEGRLASFDVLKRDPGSLVREMVDHQKAKRAGDAEDGMAPRRRFVTELAAAKLVRAVESRRQLREVMQDFWLNHFNVFAGKEHLAALLPSYDAMLRDRALGSFPELLESVARSPAMLVYLDNWRSSAPGASDARRRGGARGINENYARELLELHTLGVDGGYTQRDIVEIARCFTGWTLEEPNRDPRFVFRPRMHDFGEKRVLGHVIRAGGGESDGAQVLKILATHPSTARFVSTKLVRRFVSDDPPPALVERVAATYLRTSGDIRSMLRTIFASPEFWSRRALRAKVRSPLELVASSVRALSVAVDDPETLVKAVARIGEPLYGAQPPTGYGDTAQAWLASGALLARIDFGLQLATGKMPGVRIDLAPLAGDDPEQVLARAADRLAAGELSDRTRTYVLAELRSTPRRPEVQTARAVGLLLGAPEVQRR